MNLAPVSAAPVPAAESWQERYEALRQLALAGRQILAADPLGLVLLLRQGVAGWMRGWTDLAPTPPTVPVPATALPPAPLWQQALTQLLAEMSLAHLPGSLPL